MSNPELRTEPQPASATLDRERLHFNKVAVRAIFSDLVVSQSYLRRFQNPSAATSFPLEYAFYLLGDLHGKTVVDLGCGDGVNAIVLASLGARVIAVDISDKSLKLAGERAQANGVQERVTLTSRVLERLGVRSFSTMKRSHDLDSWILNRFASTRALASPLVWEAQKES